MNLPPIQSDAPPRYSWSHFFGGDGYPIAASIWDQDSYVAFPPHSHEFLEIVVITSGSVVQQTAQGATRLKQGQVVVLRPGSWHAYEEGHSVSACNLCFMESLLGPPLFDPVHHRHLDYLLWKAPASQENKGIFRFSISDKGMSDLLSSLTLLQRSCSNASREFRLERLGGLLTCLGILARHANPNTDNTSTPHIHPAVARVLRMVQEDLSYTWTLEELSARVNMNKSYLARVFQRATNVSVLQYVARRRAEWAAVLLTCTDSSISDIAERVGWSDPNYFARCFRKCFGMSARQYRDKHRQAATS